MPFTSHYQIDSYIFRADNVDVVRQLISSLTLDYVAAMQTDRNGGQYNFNK